MEEEKKILIDKGLSLRSEEVNEVMGKVPHHIFRAGTYIVLCVIVLLAVTGYMLQVPGYVEIPYIVHGSTASVSIVSRHTGTVSFRYSQVHDVNVGDTIVSITADGGSVDYVSPVSGVVESNFLYATGDNVVSGDTLARIVSRKSPRYKLILKIPQGMKCVVKRGMRIVFETNGITGESPVGYIEKISTIPDGANCYNAIVEMPTDIIQVLPSSGKARLYCKTENIFDKILSTKNHT